MSGVRVLILGGESLAPLCGRLREAGYDPMHVPPGDAEDCLRAVGAARPAAVFLPAAPGAAALTRRIDAECRLPVVWVIDRGAEPLVREARGAGVAAVLRPDAEAFEVHVTLELALK